MAQQRKAIFVYVMWFNADSDKKRPLCRTRNFAACPFSVRSRLVRLMLLRTLFIFPHTMCLVFYENSEYTLKVLLDIFLNCVQFAPSPSLSLLLGMPPRHIAKQAAYLVAESLSLCTTLFNVIAILPVATQTLCRIPNRIRSRSRIHIHTCTYVILLQCASTWTLIKFLRQPEYTLARAHINKLHKTLCK